jgi:hypothetical protein
VIGTTLAAAAPLVQAQPRLPASDSGVTMQVDVDADEYTAQASSTVNPCTADEGVSGAACLIARGKEVSVSSSLFVSNSGPAFTLAYAVWTVPGVKPVTYNFVPEYRLHSYRCGNPGHGARLHRLAITDGPTQSFNFHDRLKPPGHGAFTLCAAWLNPGSTQVQDEPGQPTVIPDLAALAFYVKGRAHKH